MTDFAKIVEHTTVCEIKHPATGAALGLAWELRSLTSNEVMALRRQIDNAALKLRQRGKNLTIDEVNANETDLLVAASVSFKWGKDASGEPASFGGEQLAFTPVNIKKLLAFPWIRDQLNEALADQSNFF